jgi:SnoaL-like domain
MGTTSTGNAVLERHLAAETVHDPAAAAATYHDECWYENAALGLRFEGRDMVAFQYATSWGLIPDMAARYDWELDLGNTIVQCGRITGIAGTELLGIPITGGPVDFEFTAVITLRDGLMAGEHIWYDLDGFCQQIGAPVSDVRAAASALMASAAG